MKIKGTLLATAAGFAAPVMGVSAAGAADMPLKAAPAPAPVAISWAGWYIGGHAGGAWMHSEFSSNSDDWFGASHSKTAFIGGGQIGYNWQNGNAVFGIEADGSWLSGKARTCIEFDCKSWAESKVKWLATVRGRLGLAVGNAMAYVTGGVAFGGVKATLSQTFCCFETFTKSESKTKIGWVVGGGVEAMWTRNWSWAIEGLFVDLGRHTVADGGKTTRFSTQAVIGRVKLNYRF